MNWIESSNQEVTGVYRGHNYCAKLQTYSITRAGEKALIKARGNSSNPRLSRVVMYEMLASNKAPGADYLRYQRACIIKTLSSGEKNIEQLKKVLAGYELELDEFAIHDHIEGLKAIGIDIVKRGDKYRLLDKIECLEIPTYTTIIKDDVNEIKDRVRKKLLNLNHQYLVLIDLAYSDAATRSKKNADAREFEIQTANLFTKELEFDGMRLGDSNRPDVIISYDNYGTIVDNKSYKNGFNISANSRDEMSRYVRENNMRSESLNPNKWWNNFDSHIATYTFLFITSYLTGQFEKQLEYISNANEGILGAAINVENMLYFAEGVKCGKYSYKDFYDKFNNKEMIFEIDS